MFLVELLLSQLKLIITAVLAFCSKHIGSQFVKRKFGFLVSISMLPSKLYIHHSPSPTWWNIVASCTLVCIKYIWIPTLWFV